jgi:hypothetical protein
LLDRLLTKPDGREIQGRGDCGSSVADLMSSGKTWKRKIEQMILKLNHEAAALLVGLEIGPPDHERRTYSESLAPDDVERLLVLLRYDASNTALQDAGLLRGDLRYRWT